MKFAHNGHTILESTKTGDWNKAQAYRRRRFREIHGGEDPWAKGKQATLAEIVEMVFSHYRREKRRSIKRLETSRRALWKFPKFMKGAAAASSLTETVICDEYVEWRRSQDKGNGTINNELQLLRSAFKMAYMRRDEHGRRLVPQPPIIKLLSAPEAREGFFTVPSVDTLLQAIRTKLAPQASPEDLADLVEFFWLLGWRNSSARNIERADIDWFSEELVLRRVLSKNKQPARITFGPNEELRRLLQKREALAARLESETGKRIPWLFFRTVPPYRLGEPFRSFHRAWHTAMEAAGLVSPGRPTLTPHAFRRSVARDMVDAGVDPMLACARTGWKNPGMLGRYRIISSADLSRAEEKLAEYRRGQRRAAQMALPFVRRG